MLSDPRLAPVPEGDWESREVLLGTLIGLVNEVHATTNRARSVADQVRSLIKLTGNHPRAEEISATGNLLIAKLEQWEYHVPQSELLGNVQDRIAYPSRLLSTQILHVIESMDQDPPVTDATAERVSQLSSEWSAIKGRLDAIFAAELRQFDALLKALDLDHVILTD